MTNTTTDAAEARARETFLSQLRRVNTDRYHAWVGEGQDAGILFDAAELGGEVGELLNVVKKLEREERGWRGSRAAPEDFADECADVLICLDKLARRRGVDLEAATIAKFNATSEKVGLPHRLATAEAASGAGEREALRKALIAMGRMIPGVMLTDDVSSAFLCSLPDELAHYHLHRAASLPPATDPAIPDRWTLVPVEWTTEMLDAAQAVVIDNGRGSAVTLLHVELGEIWSAALAAAPTIPATGEAMAVADAAMVDGETVIGWLKAEQDRLDAEGGDYLMDTTDCINVVRERSVALAATIPATGHAATEGEG